MKLKLKPNQITLNDFSSFSLIPVAKTYDKLRKLKAEYLQLSIELRNFPSEEEAMEKYDTQELRQDQIQAFFELLSSWEKLDSCPKGIALILVREKFLFDESDFELISERLFSILTSIGDLLENDLSSPFASDKINIEGLDVAELVLALYHAKLFGDTTEENRKKVTLEKATELVEKLTNDDQGLNLDYVSLGAGPVKFKTFINPQGTILNATEYGSGLAHIVVAELRAKQLQADTDLCLSFTGPPKGLF